MMTAVKYEFILRALMVELAFITEDDFQAYLMASVEVYAREKTRTGDWSEAESLNLSRKTFSNLLPEGRETKDNFLFSIVDVDNGSKVGVIWAGIGASSPVNGAWVWDLIIFEEFRRRGYAADALRKLEKFLAARGVARISLHVFAHNRPALHLYEKSGFSILDMTMSKSIT
jgi:ribosomal protein S18 acetylase RimI-like enzyme